MTDSGYDHMACQVSHGTGNMSRICQDKGRTKADHYHMTGHMTSITSDGADIINKICYDNGRKKERSIIN